MPLKSQLHSTYFGVVDEFHLFCINAPICAFLSGVQDFTVVYASLMY